MSSGVAGLKHETVQVKIVKKAFTLNVQAVAANSKFFKATKNRHGIWWRSFSICVYRSKVVAKIGTKALDTLIAVGILVDLEIFLMQFAK